jgi:hypothetical protein
MPFLMSRRYVSPGPASRFLQTSQLVSGTANGQAGIQVAYWAVG